MKSRAYKITRNGLLTKKRGVYKKAAYLKWLKSFKNWIKNK